MSESDVVRVHPDAEVLNSKQCSAITGIPPSTFRYWASIGQGPPSFKLGRRRVWRRAVVLAWIEQQAAS